MIPTIVLISTGLFGFGIAAILQQVIAITLDRTVGLSSIEQIGKILIWFLGNGALGVGLLKLTRSVAGADADIFAIPGYLAGFGLTTGLIVIFLILSKANNPVAKVNAVRHDTKAQILMLMLQYRVPIEDVAKLLQLPRQEIENQFVEGLRAVSRLKKRKKP